ncbi:MAG: bifunctional riboflavin kinase/FAD synthetase [Candidatus Neomarinimicrobiota bacterium]|nr:bifunctional riboflavin kinase/FAD synthetase [Candidatus Neomarinimicrobiota bacterium]
MEIITSLKDIQPIKESVLTVGNYDGIHLGHQDVINYIVEFGRKHNIPSCVITFDPNPYYVLRNENKPINIQSTESKLDVLEKMGVDKVFVIPFTKEFSKVTAMDFANKIIKEIFNPKLIAVGTNHHFGFNKEGDIEFIREFCEKNSIELFVPEVRKIGEKAISSTIMRQLIENGKLDNIPPLLGRFYGFEAKIVHGSHRGRLLSYPTANFIPFNQHQVLPEQGVYLSKVMLEGESFFGMCNIGFRPTFNEKKFVMEVHILSNKFSDLYDKSFYIEFLLKIRNEERFDSEKELVKQIEKDKEVCTKLIDSSKEKYEI